MQYLSIFNHLPGSQATLRTAQLVYINRLRDSESRVSEALQEKTLESLSLPEDGAITTKVSELYRIKCARYFRLYLGENKPPV